MIFIVIWIVTFVLMFGINNKFIPGIGGVVGLILGIRLMVGIDNLLGLVVVFVAFYQLYVATFGEEKK